MTIRNYTRVCWNVGREEDNLEQVKSCREGLGTVYKDVFIM